ncbi:hypothetical protein [uncultured Ruegeria sp.]|uniref:hypothetical protein n=1 Tax=uncultured Ruegeria sp. TaxID=259304 RepID=UPI002635F575|nr:hypothetical protein [uncultured Ruegeria sp.]
MVDVATLAIQVDTTDLQDGKAELDSFASAGRRTEQQTGKLTKSTKIAGDAARRGRTDWRQIGLQLNQVGQQTQATGNFMQALAIQLPDILMFLGPLGLAAGIATPALFGLASSFLKAGGDADDLAESLDELTDGLEAYKAAAVEGADLAKHLAEQFGVVSAESIQLAEKMQQLRLAEILISAREATDNLANSFGGYFQAELADLIKFFDEFEYTGEQSAVTAQRFAAALDELRTATGPKEQLDAVRELSEQLLDAAGNTINMTDEQRDYYSLLLQTEQRLSLVVSLTGNVADNTGVAADEAERLSGNLLDAISAQNRLDSLARGDGSITGGRGNVVPGSVDALMAGMGGEHIEMNRPKARKRGGGRSGISAGLREAERLFDSTRTKAEEYAISVERINELHRLFPEIVTTEVRDRAIGALEEGVNVLSSATDTLNDSFSDMFLSIGEGSDSAKSALAGLLDQMSQLLFQSANAGFGNGGIAGALLGAIGIPSADGGGFTGSGPRSGGLDGKGGQLWMLHPNETIVDHTKGQSMGGGVTISIDARGAQEGVAEQVERKVRSMLPEIQRASVSAVGQARQDGFPV